MKTRAALLLALALACRASGSEGLPPGFDPAGSDPRAVEVARAVQRRLGGRAAWDEVGALHWEFFGARTLTWDRRRGRCRVEAPERTAVVDLARGGGRAWDADGREITLANERDEALEWARRAWVNDSYWLLMPLKMLDPGVRLHWVGEASGPAGRPARVVELTFDGVGDTPENRYRVWVDRETDLVTRWDFYADAHDPQPTLSTPWTGWRAYGDVWLSGGRGERSLDAITVYDDLSADALLAPEPFDPSAWPSRPPGSEVL